TANQQAMEAMQKKAVQYYYKYATGWRNEGLKLLGQKELEPINITAFDDAAGYAGNFVDALHCMECPDALNAAYECGKNAYAKRDLAIAEFRRWQEIEGATKDALIGNLEDKAIVLVLSSAVGMLATLTAQVTLPALPAALIASKVFAAIVGSGVSGAATE